MLEQVKALKYIESIITDDIDTNERRSHASTLLNTLLSGRQDSYMALLMSKRLSRRLVKSFVHSVTFHEAEIWNRRKRMRAENSFDMLTWRIMENLKWMNRVRNEEALRRIA